MRISMLLILAILLLTVTSRRKKEELARQIQPKQQQKTVVQANHFFSSTETTTSYNITSVEKDKSLLFFLKPKTGESGDNTLKDNPINITLQDGSDKQNCLFDSYTDLCSLPKVTAAEMKLGIACKKTPCELSWIILQPSVQEQDGYHNINQLVAVNSDYNHAFVSVSCNNPELTETFAKEIRLYSSSKFIKIESMKGIVHFVFSNNEKGYYFLTSDNEKARNCANASLFSIKDDVDFTDVIIQDFISPSEKNVYEFNKIPEKDFSVNGLARTFDDGQLKNNTSVRISLVGYNGDKPKIVSSLILALSDEKNSFQFSVAYKKPAQKFQKMQLQMRATGQFLSVQLKFIADDTQMVELDEETYFDLKKGEKINFKIIPLDSTVKGIDKVNIFPSNDKIFKVNATSCPITGCDFSLQALQDGQGSVFIGVDAVKNVSQVVVKQFTGKVTQKGREGEQYYFSMSVKKDQSYQLLVNSPNVIVYAASKTKCPRIDQQKCYQKNFNYHNPSIYQAVGDDTLQFKVLVLDNSEFTITTLKSDSNFITLVDTVPFTYLMDNKQNFLMFMFRLKDKQDVSFNLIGPTNELVLTVYNIDKPTKDSKNDGMVSSDGFIKYAKEEIKGLGFLIKVEKREEFRNKYVHFTMIVSSKQANLRLQSGVAHYQTLKSKDSRDYVFQFTPQKSTLINFYCHNLKSDVNLNLKVSNADQYTKQQNTGQFTLDRQVDVFDLSLISKKLCKESNSNCEIFIRLTNVMEVEVDVTITLMLQNSIVELKDGIWQNYQTNMVTSSSHFYFLPKHQNHSTTIFYKSTLVDLKIMYALWKTDDKSIDISEWPFPVQYKENQNLSQLTFKPIDFIHIESDQLKICWPDCVILLSIAPDVNAFKNTLAGLKKDGKDDKMKQIMDNSNFKIMASNNYIQLPQKHKVDIILVKDQEKELLVDLKYFLQKQSLSFSAYFTMGNTKLKANVYSEMNPRCPSNEDTADFQFTGIDTVLSMADIKTKLSDNSMQDHRNVYLCIMAHAITDSKFTIEFTSDAEGMKMLTLDSTSTLKSDAKQVSFYQMDTTQQFQLKITRTNGFPDVASVLCKQGKDMQSCIEGFKSSQDTGKQIADKVTTLSQPACVNCLFLVKITSKQPSQINIHLQSRYTEIELIQNSIMTDQLQPNEQNRYTLTGTNDEEIVINVQLISGNLKVGVHDFQTIDLAKTNQQGSKNIHIVIPPKNKLQKSSAIGDTHMNSFSLSSFVHLHITVQSQNAKESALYTITYSSGDVIVYLQDGLITQYNLMSKKMTKFLYINPTQTPIYLHLSATDTNVLSKITIKLYALDKVSDQTSMVQMIPQKSNFKKKTPNPTMLLLLPVKQNYLIAVTNDNQKDSVITLGVNNRQIIYLPFDHEFPVQLLPTQFIYIVLSCTAPGYVKVSFSKCDESAPFIGYTLDYDEFVKEEFSVQEQMSDQISQDLIIKVKGQGSVYLKVRSPDDDRSLMTVKALFNPNKINPSRAKPGDKGLIKYQLLDSTKAELTLTGLVCATNDKNCNKDFSYSSISSSRIQNVYEQLVCPSIMFDLSDMDTLKSADTTPIPSSSVKNNKVSFNQEIKGDIIYVGVKASNSKTGEVVYYRPIQIVTFWGELNRTSKMTKILGICLSVMFLGGVLIIYRRWKKQEYRPLNDFNDNLDRD